MINKRLLIKSLLSHTGENSFYDKKRFLNIGQKEGKGKFLKHVCALANSNPNNNSFIVVGVEDEDNKIVGVDFFDDSKIQNWLRKNLGRLLGSVARLWDKAQSVISWRFLISCVILFQDDQIKSRKGVPIHPAQFQHLFSKK